MGFQIYYLKAHIAFSVRFVLNLQRIIGFLNFQIFSQTLFSIFTVSTGINFIWADILPLRGKTLQLSLNLL